MIEPIHQRLQRFHGFLNGLGKHRHGDIVNKGRHTTFRNALQLLHQIFRIQVGKTTQEHVDAAAAGPKARRRETDQVVLFVFKAKGQAPGRGVAPLLALEHIGSVGGGLLDPIVDPIIGKAGAGCRQNKDDADQEVFMHGYLPVILRLRERPWDKTPLDRRGAP
ncbi:hypothetical protein DESC_920049 [Desulfosarcina cetonica]|nr:hypothetical protein DESC_920049 [Desulfosarcina cetonica]